MLSQGGEVKTLGIEGQRSIRENFLFVRMGTFARNTDGIAPGERYPAALVRGYRSDDPPVPLNTAGLTMLPLDNLPNSVAWAPDPALVQAVTPLQIEQGEPWTDDHDKAQAYLEQHPNKPSKRELARHLWGEDKSAGRYATRAGQIAEQCGVTL
jgi:hypothetical protein